MSTHEPAAIALTRAARASARVVANAPTRAKNDVLRRVSANLRAATADLVAANARDLADATDLSPALRDRLRLDARGIAALADAVDAIADLPDPVGRIDHLDRQPSGIEVGRMQIPLGVILIVYEARPNVTIDAAALCLKSGNAVILRGGREASHSNRALAAIFRAALTAFDLPADAVQLVGDPDRELLYALLGRSGEIDVAIPRGGTALIRAVDAHARVPVIRHWQGICHVYVHAFADLDVAERIVINAKVQRPGVCNAMECVLVDRAVAAVFVPRIVAALGLHGVQIRACEATCALVPAAANLIAATPEDFDTEFLDKIAACKVVDGLDAATGFIADHGSHHTAAIVTRDHDAAMRFLREVDASCVLVNASTRFNDGGELGLGAELGISTSKLHAYGPMGLDELCARKFVVLGHGETR